MVKMETFELWVSSEMCLVQGKTRVGGIFTDLCHTGVLTETWLGRLLQNQNNKRLTQTRISRTRETQLGQGQTVHLTAEQ